MTTPSFLPPGPAPAAPRLRLLCVPFAGGGAGIYRTWQEAIGDDVHVVPLQLPGRERRLRDAPYTSMDRLIDDLAPAVLPLLDRDWAIFGHSMGAAVAWELALRLTALGKPPIHFFPSARRSPDLSMPHPPLFALPEARLIAETERHYGPLPDILKSHAGLLATFLPTMRADFQLLDTWTPKLGPPLPCPITAFGGEHDTAIPPESLLGWRACTTGRFARHILPGGHFFVRDDHTARDLLRTILR